MELQDALKQTIRSYGKSILVQKKLLYILDDLMVFRYESTLKYLFRFILNENGFEPFITTSDWSTLRLKCNNFILRHSLDDRSCMRIFECLAYSLDLINSTSTQFTNIIRTTDLLEEIPIVRSIDTQTAKHKLQKLLKEEVYIVKINDKFQYRIKNHHHISPLFTGISLITSEGNYAGATSLRMFQPYSDRISQNISHLFKCDSKNLIFCNYIGITTIDKYNRHDSSFSNTVQIPDKWRLYNILNEPISKEYAEIFLSKTTLKNLSFISNKETYLYCFSSGNERIKEFEDNKLLLVKNYNFNNDPVYGLIRYDGVEIVEPKYDEDIKIWNHRIICPSYQTIKSHGRYYDIYDFNGRHITQLSYHSIKYDGNLLKLYPFLREYVDIFDNDGKQLYHFKYENVILDKQDFFYAQRNQKWGYINSKGVEIIPTKYDTIKSVTENYFIVSINVDHKELKHFRGQPIMQYYGVIDSFDRIIQPIEYFNFIFHDNLDLIFGIREDQITIFDKNFSVITSVNFVGALLNGRHPESDKFSNLKTIKLYNHIFRPLQFRDRDKKMFCAILCDNNMKIGLQEGTLEYIGNYCYIINDNTRHKLINLKSLL